MKENLIFVCNLKVGLTLTLGCSLENNTKR